VGFSRNTQILLGTRISLVSPLARDARDTRNDARDTRHDARDASHTHASRASRESTQVDSKP
jgi:hypothetical protein